ncbi:hypothetical protein [Reyranella sp.]|uniref:hypothetical protein n=1 Tax=Reyranella sp. TaxID=1929291 RepID=UPI0040357C41
MSKAQSNIPIGVWRDLLALVEARESELWPLTKDLFSMTGSEQPFRDVRISPSIVGASLGQRMIDELNRRLSALPEGHEFQRAAAYSVGHGAAIFTVPPDMSGDTIENLKKWVTDQVERLGVDLNLHRQINAVGTFGG